MIMKKEYSKPEVNVKKYKELKVKKEKEEICCVQCFHVKILLFCLKYDANVMLFR